MTPGRFSVIAKSFTQTPLPESEVELVGDVPFAEVQSYEAGALAHLAEHMELPGFRPGKVPADLARKKLGDVAILEEAVELFVKDFYPELIAEQHIDAIGRPDIRITKLAPGSPVGLSVRTSVYPTLTYPKNWKELGGSVPKEIVPEATEEDVAKTLESLRQSAAQAAAAKQTPLLDAEGKPLPPPLPEMTDEWAQSLGAFKTMDELRAQIHKGITEEKARAARDARRGKLIEVLLEQTTVAVPRIFIESELDKIMAQMREDVARFGITFEDYLTRVQKTEDALRAELREQAQKRAKLQLTLNKLAEDEKIEADKEAVEEEMKHAIEHFPDAKPALVRIHIETVLRNEKVLQMLEGEDKKAE